MAGSSSVNAQQDSHKKRKKESKFARTEIFRGGFSLIKPWILAAGRWNKEGQEREQGRRLTERKFHIRILGI